jgi:hypothetical protein
MRAGEQSEKLIEINEEFMQWMNLASIDRNFCEHRKGHVVLGRAKPLIENDFNYLP